MKLILKLIIAGISFFLLVSNVSAQGSDTSVAANFDVTIKPDNSVRVIMEMQITNQSSQSVLTNLNLQIPLEFSGLRVTKNGVDIPASLNNGKVFIDLKQDPIKLKQTAKLELHFETNNIVRTAGVVKTVFWPQFNFDDAVKSYAVNIFYPESWGNITFSSREYQVSSSRFGYKTVSSRENRDIYLETGSYNKTRVKLPWKINNNHDNGFARLALPGGNFNTFSYQSVEVPGKGARDAAGNHSAFIELLPLELKQGDISGLATPKVQSFQDYLGESEYYKDIAFLKLTSNSSYEELIDQILIRTKPLLQQVFERNNIEKSISKPLHTSLDYATLVTGALRSRQTPAQIVFGFVRFPGTSTYHLHFWVAYKNGNDWKQIDPYLADLYGFDVNSGITTDRFSWGILPEQGNVEDLGIQYYTQEELFFDFIKDNQVQGISGPVTTNLRLLEKAYSGQQLPLALEINNLTTNAVFVKEIVLDGLNTQNDNLGGYLVLPGKNEEIRLYGVVLSDPFFTGEKKLGGEVVIKQGVSELSFPLSLSANLEINHGSIVFNTILVLLILVAISLSIRWVLHKLFWRNELIKKN